VLKKLRILIMEDDCAFQGLRIPSINAQAENPRFSSEVDRTAGLDQDQKSVTTSNPGV
jgi:hypothetical protein